MNKRNLVLLVVALLASSVQAKTHSDKTFMSVRSVDANQTMRLAGWHTQQGKTAEEKCGTSLQATGFYRESTNAKQLGQYFSSTDLSSPYTKHDFISVNNNSSSDAQFLTQNILHVAGGAPALGSSVSNEVSGGARTLSSKLVFRPQYSAAGLDLAWNQRLDKITEGLWLRVALPIANVQTTMGMRVSGTEATQNLAVGIVQGARATSDALNTLIGAKLTGAAVSFSSFMNGDVSNTDTSNLQSALTAGKVNTASRSKTALADINVMLGYDVYNQENHRVGINLAFVIPTGSESKGEFLFEPVSGYNGHWLLGCGVDADLRIWTDKKHDDRSLSFLAVADYRYMFEATEKRMASFSFRNSSSTNEMPQYMLGGQVNTTVGQNLFPLANVLTRDHNVTPGSAFEMTTAFALCWDNFVFDTGYNLFYKETEKVSVRSWSEDTYGAILNQFPTFNAVTVGSFQGGNVGTEDQYALGTGVVTLSGSSYNGSIRKSDLIMPITPSVLTHKVFGQASYIFKDCEFPVMLSCGGSYEFASDNAAVSVWGINGKIGVSF